MTSQHDTKVRAALLREWIGRRLNAEQLGWIDERLGKIASSDRAGDLAISVGLAPRKLGKSDLNVTADEARDMAASRPGIDVSGWSVDQAARVLFVLVSYRGDDAAFPARLNQLFQTGEISEHIALLQGLPLYPAARELIPRAAEGIRSAMQPVFEAVAHKNPYPNEQFDEAQWNQMVLKSLFIGSTLAPIQGLDARRNADLAATLMDYVHECWAAGRDVSPELWRCVGPFARPRDIVDLAKALNSPNTAESTAAALALSECPLADAQDTLNSKPELLAAIGNGRITWNNH